MLKLISKDTTAEWISPDDDTVIAIVKPFTGAHNAFTIDTLSNLAIDECILSLTNVAVEIEKRVDGEMVTELVEFEKFIPKEHPRVKLHKVLPHPMATGIFNVIWGISTLSKVESGE